MSDIIINEKNLSRFTKRLQKSINVNLNQEIPLNMASLILAQALGVDSIYNLQQKLSIQSHDVETDKPTPVTTIEFSHIKNFIENYFKTHINSKIVSFSAGNEENKFTFNMSGFNKFNKDLTGFSIYLGYKSDYITRELSQLDLDKSDIEFINKLVSFLHFDDLPKSLYLGELLKQDLNTSLGAYSFKFNNSFQEVTNYGLCEKLWVLVKEDFFERVGGSFVLNDKYCFIDLKNENAQIFKSFEDIEKHIDSQHIALEFLTPINQFSSLIPESEHRIQGICSHYVYLHNDLKLASTVNSSYQKYINSVEDYYYFYGQNVFNITPNKEYLSARLFSNTPYRKEILSGFDSCYVKNQHMKSKK